VSAELNLWQGIVIAESLHDPTLINTLRVNRAEISSSDQPLDEGATGRFLLRSRAWSAPDSDLGRSRVRREPPVILRRIRQPDHLAMAVRERDGGRIAHCGAFAGDVAGGQGVAEHAGHESHAKQVVFLQFSRLGAVEGEHAPEPSADSDRG
jgi:hypothetical protein